MSSTISFQGLATNLPTDSLVSAIIAQESQPMLAMQAQQATNNTKASALKTLSSDLTNLGSAMSTLATTGFSGDTVTSSDSTGAYVTATASGAVAGQYDVAVKALATRARLVVPTALQPSAAVGTGTYSITDMAGNTVNVNIDSTNNTLSGLAAAINAATDQNGNPSDVTASVIQTGADGTSQLVLSAANTGTGAAGATTFQFTTAAGSTLGAGGTSTAATNADFFVNGVELTRTSNTVSDAVQGVTFNLNQAQTDLTKTTTLTVAQDQNAATAAMQAVVTAYNQFYKDYQNNNTFTQNSDGSYTTGVFNMDMTIRNLVTEVSTSLLGNAGGLPSTASYSNAADVGVSTNIDGSLSLNTGDFQAALKADPTAVQNLFANSGTSTNPLLSYVASGANTTNSPIAYSVAANADGSLTATLTVGSGQPLTLNSANGFFVGAAGTALDGLTFQASAGATGTLQVSTGVASPLQALITSLTDSNPGDIGGLISNLSQDNANLQLNIDQQQNYLKNSKASLEAVYANLESTVGQLQAAGQSLSTF